MLGWLCICRLIGKWHIILNDVCVCVKTVSANSEKIGAEELQCKALAENAQRDLDEALPALEEAMKVNLRPDDCLNYAALFLRCSLSRVVELLFCTFCT